VVWRLDQNQDLRLVDKLGYARVAIGKPDILAERLDLNSLGPEALGANFNVEYLSLYY
jgi:formamidopyrimidine-DNA glycosylase